jgi:succinate dehydrogenase/fumarate reductase flavoprotein subunit
MTPENLGKVIETDVLVIGGGVAGLWAANTAKQSVDRVLIVDKGPVDWGGLASMAGGDMDAVMPGENPDDFVKDLVYYYDGLCQQEVVEQIFRHSYERLQDYQKWGCQFLTGPDGKLKGILQRSLEHVKLYPAKLGTRGGPDMVECLVKESERLGVKRLGRTLVTDLIKNDGSVVGATGFDVFTGEFLIFKTNAVVLATGQAGWKSTKATSSGEGMWMAIRAGAEVSNCEFGSVGTHARLFEWEGKSKMLPLGARFVNAAGESYMDRYSPRFGSNTDGQFNVKCMALEAREGRAPFYFDTSKVTEQDIELVKPHSGWQLLNYEKLKRLGIDVFRDNTEWIPQPTALFAGIMADARGRTSVPGLFVGGRVRLVDGGVYMGGFALCNTAVTGHIAGEAAAEYVRSNLPVELALSEAEPLKEGLMSFMGEPGVTPKELLTEIRRTVFPYEVSVLKTAPSLAGALKKIQQIKLELEPRMKAKDYHYLMKLWEVRGILFMSELFLRASLVRNESRSGHYREDYPERNDRNWLKWIVFGLEEGKLKTRFEPVPFDKYKFKFEKSYSDNFKFDK